MAFNKKEKSFKRVKNKAEKKSGENLGAENQEKEVMLSPQKRKKQTEFGYVISELANLTGKSAETIKDECCFFQLEKYLSGVCKVIVRQNVSDKTLEQIFLLSKKLMLKEFLIAPAYLGAVRKIVDKNGLLSLKVNLLIDFPFGESSFKSKMTELKIGKSVGVDGVTVVLQSALLNEKNRKELIWQVKKFSKAFSENCSIAVSAHEITEMGIKSLISAIEKSKAQSLTILFGETSEIDLKEKIELVNKYKGRVPVKILASVSSVEGLRALFSLGVEDIYTPYADEIAKELLKKFNILKESL